MVGDTDNKLIELEQRIEMLEANFNRKKVIIDTIGDLIHNINVRYIKLIDTLQKLKII